MGDENKAVLENANKAISRGDYEGFLAFCTDDTEWNFVGDKTLLGKQAVREWMKETYDEPPTFKVTAMIAEGNFVIAMGTIELRQENGTKAHFEYCDVWRFKNGKMDGLKAFVVESKSDREH